MAGADPTFPWDAPSTPGDVEGVTRLSRMVSGNDNLVTQPGLVQALYENNATPQQAQAIDQFLAGLKAEQAVRTAAAAGTKIRLSQDEQAALTAMGINYMPVLHQEQTPASQLQSELAARGQRPVLGTDGQPKTDAHGNVITEAIPGAFGGPAIQNAGSVEQAGGGTGILENVVGAVGSLGSSVGHGLSDIYHGHMPGVTPVPGQQNPISLSNTFEKLNEGYQWVSSTASQYKAMNEGDVVKQFQADEANARLARDLGYDPSSLLSMQAFKARGYQHNDTSGLAQQWDDAHPNGQFGWSGADAVTAAEVYATDPKKYVENIVNSTTDPAIAAEQIRAVSSQEFQDLVKRVNGARADIGADVATGLGIDPVKHATLFTATSTVANLAAMIATDPIGVGAGIYRARQIGTVTLKGLDDAVGIRRVFLPEDGAKVSTAQQRSIDNLTRMVNWSNEIRAAYDARDVTRATQLTAELHASNPFAPLLGDFLGQDQIIRKMTEQEAAAAGGGKGALPFVYGKGDVIDTYDKAVTYLASKSALLRLQGGMAPVETAVMPGALSSVGYLRLKGKLASWSAGRDLGRLEQDASKFIASAQADPGKLEAMIDQGFLTRSMPTSTDAVDALSGKVIAAEQKSSVARGRYAEAASRLDQIQAELARLDEGAKASGRTNILDWSRANADSLALSRVRDTLLARSDAADAELASARRALENAKNEAAAPETISITDDGLGMLRGNRLRYGRAQAPESTLGKIASIYTLGTAQRVRQMIARFGNQLPRDVEVKLTSTASIDTIRKIARTYLTRGDANLLTMRWIHGTVETRKTIVEGLKEQIAHAAGLPRTEAGRRLMDEWRSANQKYATVGREFTDSNGVPAAQWPGQVQTTFRLPNFGAVHKASAKVGLYEATMGRLLTSTALERLMALWKVNVLMSPVTAARANVESWLNAAAEGMFKDGVQAKAILRDAGKLSYKEVARSRPVDWVLSWFPLQAAGRFYRYIAETGMSEDVARAIREMPDDIQQLYIHEQLAGHYAMSVDPGGVGEATQIAKLGYRPARATFSDAKYVDAVAKHRDGYELTRDTDAVAGANLYAHNLGLRVNRSPDVAKAVIARLRNPELGPEGVIKALESGQTGRLMEQSLFGKVYINSAGEQVRATTDAEVLLGKQQWANQITKEFEQVVTGRNGTLQEQILKHIETSGKAPDADWILKHVKGENRPQALLKPMIHAVVNEGDRLQFLSKLADHILETEGKGYRWLVERLIQRHATSPLFAAAYGRAKVGLEDFKQSLVDEAGWTDAAAERVTADMAASQAWERIARMVDDPHMKTQLDVVGRGFFAFSRATTMMLRRWASTFWRNPAQARRFQLSVEAAQHSGFVYQDPSTGEWMFTFPASGVAQEVILHAISHIPGLSGMAQFPTSDFTGRVSTIIPGSSNPFQYSTTPMVSITGRWLANFFPEYRGLFDKVDAKLNGSMGQGQSALSTLEPTLLKKLLDAGWFESGQNRGSMLGSAMMGALYYLYAAGKVPPEGASDVEFERFLGRLRTQTKGVLTLRGIFGTLSPAVVSLPQSGEQLAPADAAFMAAGAKNLRDEYKVILNETGGDFARATAIWVALHPDEVMFTQSTSQSTVKGANMPMTDAALHWMEQNSGFLNTYKSVAAYFMPEKKGPFSDAAYRAQIEEGVRQYKTPMEFLKGLYYAQAASQYYPMEDKYLADVAKLKADGNDAAVTQANKDWDAWSRDFKNRHPVFAQQVQAAAGNAVAAQSQLKDLETMVKNGDVPGGDRVKSAVSGMIDAWNGYAAFRDQHLSGTKLDVAARQAAFGELQKYMQGVVAAVPQLGDLYNGVFRGLDNHLASIG